MVTHKHRRQGQELEAGEGGDGGNGGGWVVVNRMAVWRSIGKRQNE